MKKIFLSHFFLTTLFLLAFAKNIHALTLEDCENGANDPGCIEILSAKINQLGDQKKTLSNEISQFNSQIQLTQLKITDAQATLEKLEKEIDALGARIGNIAVSVDKLEILLKKRIVATYQQSFISDLEFILTANNFSDFILRAQYLKQVQENDRKILANLQQSKATYATQKDDREIKQVQIEESKRKLEALEISLDQQKAAKQGLLTATQNDESKYQKLLAQAQAELAVAFGGGTETFLRDVSVQENIGSIARHDVSPGCSSGGHLHFEVQKDGSIQNPNNFLKPIGISYSYSDSQKGYYGTVSPSGDLPWPVNEPVYINQGFGTSHGYASFYGSSGHTGIDMQTGSDSGDGDSVKAVKSGKLYGGSYKCGGTYPGSLLYARVKHDDGLDSLYLHIVPH